MKQPGAVIKTVFTVLMLVFALNGCDEDSTGWITFITPDPDPNIPTIIEANIGTVAAQIGGATQDVELYNDGTQDWLLYTMANRFAATPLTLIKGAVTEISVPGYIQHITLVNDYAGKNYALLSMGSKGIGVVDITTPTAMVYVRTMTVNYMTPEITLSDGGGNILVEEASIEPLTNGPVNDLLINNTTLYIANTAFGIQTTSLANLMDATADGVLTIDGVELWTLKYAGENPWGGPLSFTLHGGRLYVSLGFLGVSIYNPDTLAKLGSYNLYTDCSYPEQEDWFGYPERKISCPDAGNTDLVVAPDVDGVSAVDADGMPSYVQAAYELQSKNDLTWYPWAL